MADYTPGDRQLGREHHRPTMEGIVHGVPKRSHRPVVDGIITGVPRTPMPSVKTPTTDCHASATRVPLAAFGSGIFQHSAGPSAGKHEAKEEKPKRGRKKADA